MCFDVYNPVDISVNELPTNAKIDLLNERRELSLLCIMYEMKQLKLYEHIGGRATPQGDKYMFHTDIAFFPGFFRLDPARLLGHLLCRGLPKVCIFVSSSSRIRTQVLIITKQTP